MMVALGLAGFGLVIVVACTVWADLIAKDKAGPGSDEL